MPLTQTSSAEYKKMTENKAVFLPITEQSYKQRKIALLKFQLKQAQTQQRMQRIQKIRKIKTQQLKLLKKTIKKLTKDLNKLEKPFPNNISTAKYTKEHQEHQNQIDKELITIQKKLKSLNQGKE